MVSQAIKETTVSGNNNASNLVSLLDGITLGHENRHYAPVGQGEKGEEVALPDRPIELGKGTVPQCLQAGMRSNSLQEMVPAGVDASPVEGKRRRSIPGMDGAAHIGEHLGGNRRSKQGKKGECSGVLPRSTSLPKMCDDSVRMDDWPPWEGDIQRRREAMANDPAICVREAMRAKIKLSLSFNRAEGGPIPSVAGNAASSLHRSESRGTEQDEDDCFMDADDTLPDMSSSEMLSFILTNGS